MGYNIKKKIFPPAYKEQVNEGEFEITYTDPMFNKPRQFTIKAQNADKAVKKFTSYGNSHKVLDVKKKERGNTRYVKEAQLPDDFIPEPVVSQTLADMELTMDPMSNEFYEYAYNKLLNNYLATHTPEIKKKFNNAWNTAWAVQMRELYAKEQAKIKGRGKFGKVEESDNVLNKFYRMGYDNGYDKGTKDHIDYSKMSKQEANLFNKGFDSGLKDAKVDDADIRGMLARGETDLPEPEPRTMVNVAPKKVNEDPTPKRRIMDFDNHSRYWSGNGEYQDAYNKLYSKLVPAQGKAETQEGELLRAVGKIIYRHGNDGDNFSNASYEFIEKVVGKFDNLDDMADKVTQYVVKQQGNYTPNAVDFLDIADYGPGEYEQDWEQVGCQNCGGTGEIEYQNDDGEDDYEECDSCDGNGWIEQTSESVVNELKVKSNKRQRADDHHQKNRRTPGNVKGVKADSKDLKNTSRDETKKDSNFEKVQEGTGLYPYKGWEYEQEIDHWPDVSKIDHIAKKDGKEVDIDWSPYTNMTEEQFKTWIDLGMPDRKAVNGIGPLDHNDLDSLMKTKLGTKARLTQEAKDDKKADKKTKDAGSDLTSKMDVKTKMALKKQQAKSAGITKGDPVAALAMGLEKDVKTNKQEIAQQAMTDKFLDQQINKALKTLADKKTPDEEVKKDKEQDDEIAQLKARMDQLMGRG